MKKLKEKIYSFEDKSLKQENPDTLRDLSEKLILHKLAERKIMKFFEKNAFSTVDYLFELNNEKAFSHCVNQINNIYIEANCLIGRKEQLGEYYKPLLIRAIEEIEKALTLLEEENKKN